MRWWATLRGQTLGRTLFGLMEMREALVDVTYLELKAVRGGAFLDVDYHAPTRRARYDEVLAWLQRNRYWLFSRRALLRDSVVMPHDTMQWLCGETALRKSVAKVEALATVVAAELASRCFLEHYGAHAARDPAGAAYRALLARDADGEFWLPTLMLAEVEAHAGAMDQLLGEGSARALYGAVACLREALEALVQVGELRLMAEQLVADKFQVRRRDRGPSPQQRRGVRSGLPGMGPASALLSSENVPWPPIATCEGTC